MSPVAISHWFAEFAQILTENKQFSQFSA